MPQLLFSQVPVMASMADSLFFLYPLFLVLWFPILLLCLIGGWGCKRLLKGSPGAGARAFGWGVLGFAGFFAGLFPLLISALVLTGGVSQDFYDSLLFAGPVVLAGAWSGRYGWSLAKERR